LCRWIFVEHAPSIHDRNVTCVTHSHFPGPRVFALDISP
jgi:hypothetical protein